MNKKTLILLLFILAKFVLQYWLIDPVYDLHRDEYLHLDQGKHLAWGYLSVPPVTSWFSYIILQLGNSFFWIKFFPALFGALTLLPSVLRTGFSIATAPMPVLNTSSCGSPSIACCSCLAVK